MAKISKPVGWFAFLALVGGVAFYFLGEPEGGHKRATHTAKESKSTALPGFTDADMKAQFARLNTPLKDVFTPKVVVKKTAVTANAPGVGLAVQKPTWALTGVYVYNGVRLALLENMVTGESKSVKAGESWMGQQILSVTTRGVLLANGTQMLFPEPPEETSTGVTPVLLPNGPTVPASGGARPGVAADPQANRPLNLNLPSGVAATQPTGSRP